MRSFFTLSSAIGTESAEVVFTYCFPDVFFGTVWAKRTEAFFVVGAEGDFGVGVDVEVETFFAVGAITVANKEVAFGHFASVLGVGGGGLAGLW